MVCVGGGRERERRREERRREEELGPALSQWAEWWWRCVAGDGPGTEVGPCFLSSHWDNKPG